MRYLYNEFYKKDRNYSPADFQNACEAIAGASLEEFFAKYVRGRDEIDYQRSFEIAGLHLETVVRDAAGKPVERVYFGADVAQENDRVIVRRVYAGSPAYEQGLNTDDQIIALNNMRVNKDFFDARMAEKRPGELINLTIFRFDDLSTLLIKLGGRTDGTYRLLPVESPTEQQRQIYRSWLRTSTPQQAGK